MGPDCYVCGTDNDLSLKLVFAFARGDALVRAVFSPRAEHCGAAGFVHGGALAACMDETLAAVGHLEDDDTRFVTAKLELKYLRPVSLEDGPIQFEGWVDKEMPFGYQASGRARTRRGDVAVAAKGLFARV
jgi:acyl-coenzyme A thioesterase PaaI-like protein